MEYQSILYYDFLEMTIDFLMKFISITTWSSCQ